MKNNVEQIVEKKLCSGCGSCSYVCKHIKIVQNEAGFKVPKVSSSCVNCGRCLEVCSSNNSSNYYFENNFFKALKQENCSIGYAKNTNIREYGASGGVITAILIYLLEHNIVDGCIVAYSDGKLENTKAIIATSKDDILNSRSSKYMPIDMCSVLKKVDTKKKYVFVGKGCDVKGLTLLQDKFVGIRNSIILKIALMCAGTPSLNATKKLYKKMTGNNYSDSSKFYYRVKGWPGNSIAQDTNLTTEMSYSKSWCENLAKECNSVCRVCLNHLPEDADLVVGDAWCKNKNLDNKSGGYSLIVTLNESANKFLNLMENDIELEHCNVADIKFSQEYLFEITEKAFIYDYFKNFKKKKNYLKLNTMYVMLKKMLFYNVKFIKYVLGNLKRLKK